MCGRYTLNTTTDYLDKRFQVSQSAIDVKPNYNVTPSQTMPVITEREDGTRQLEFMKWGIPRILGKDFVKEIINTRSDKAFGGFWKRTVINNRCLIPATSFFEWKKTKTGKIPFLIHPKDVEIYAFAGIWSTWKDREENEIKAYSIMTTEPNKEMKDVHDREPVILYPEDEEQWINPKNTSPGVLSPLLYPYQDSGLEIYEVSKEVNSPRNNDKSLIEAI